MYSLCRENKGPDQLCCYYTVDVHHCFSHMQNADFLMGLLSYSTAVKVINFLHTQIIAVIIMYYMSLVMRKPAFCICENKDADQLRGNREADPRLCFHYIDSTISLLPKYDISSL